MNYLSICAIAKGEANYIGEWLKYHFYLGVDHVYLYDNSIEEELHRLESDKITVISVSGAVMQPYAYNSCLTYYREDNRWIAFIDVDEFIVPKITNNLKEFLVPYEKYSAVCPHWKFFGCSGRTKYENIPVIERFTKCQIGYDEHVKSIVNPKLTFKYITPHRFTHISPAVDEHKRYLEEGDAKPKPYTGDLIQINHYVTKSLEECAERRKHPRPDTGEVRDLTKFLQKHDRNEDEDLTALKIWKSIPA